MRSTPPPQSPKSAEIRSLSARFVGNSDEISGDFAPVQWGVFGGFSPDEMNSVSIVGWQSDESTEQ